MENKELEDDLIECDICHKMKDLDEFKFLEITDGQSVCWECSRLFLRDEEYFF